jgi:broad specificity phosphatase PhoE
LTKLGEDQAKQTGKYIYEIFGDIDAIYHSPIYRCQQTAEIIAKNANYTKKLIQDELLYEIDVKSNIDNESFEKRKEWRDKLNNDIDKITKNKNPYKKLLLYKKYVKRALLDIESYPNHNDILHNYKKFLNKIKNTEHKRIIIVGHGGTTEHMLKILCKINIYNDLIFPDNKINIRNCSICCVLLKKNKFQVISFPNNEHLEK